MANDLTIATNARRRRAGDGSQADTFRDLARQIGADEDEKRFEETVKKVAKAPAPKHQPKAKP